MKGGRERGKKGGRERGKKGGREDNGRDGYYFSLSFFMFYVVLWYCTVLRSDGCVPLLPHHETPASQVLVLMPHQHENLLRFCAVWTTSSTVACQ